MSSEGFVGRRKSRQACEQCRQSKRKCDGKVPCYSCRRYEHLCSYSPRPRKRARIQSENSSDEQISPIRHAVQNDEITTPVLKIIKEQSETQINFAAPVPTGNTFARGLMAELSNGNTQSFECSSWNVGLRLGSAYEKTILDLAGLEEAKRYSQVYFEKINPVYSIVDPVCFRDHLQNRWASSSTQTCEYDAIICGVIALGSLFSGANAFHRESQIVELGETMLGRWTPVDRFSHSTLPIATAWILRVLYLRMAVDPRAAWQASRSSILALEAYTRDNARNEQDSRCTALNTTDSTNETQIHRKIHWITRLLDTWIRNEFYPSQRDREIITIPCPLPTQPPPGTLDFTSTLISLYVISLSFSNSAEQKSLSELTEILEDINALPMSGHDVLQLHKSNHALCIYRFMRCTASVIPKRTLSRILGIAKPGLVGALRLARDSQPWWHVLHFPFQLLCVALSMDTAESLVLVEDSMVALRAVQQYFPTTTVQKAVRVAEHLVHMCQKSKLEAADTLNRSTQSILNSSEYPSAPGEKDSRAPVSLNSTASSPTSVQGNGNDFSTAPNETNQMGFDLFDWEKFLRSDFAYDLGFSDPYSMSHTEGLIQTL